MFSEIEIVVSNVGTRLRWIWEFVSSWREGGGGGCNLATSVVNESVFGVLVAGDLGFGFNIIVETPVDIEMVRCEEGINGNLWGFFEIPKLERTHLINNCAVWLDLVEDVESRSTNVADEKSVFAGGGEEGFCDTANSPLAFCTSDADDRCRTLVEEYFCTRSKFEFVCAATVVGEGFLVDWFWRDGWRANDHVIGAEVDVGELVDLADGDFFVSDKFLVVNVNLVFGEIGAEVAMSGLSFCAKAENCDFHLFPPFE